VLGVIAKAFGIAQTSINLVQQLAHAVITSLRHNSI